MNEHSAPGAHNSRWLWPLLALVSLWLIHAAANVLWLHIDTLPPFYDAAGNASVAVQFAELPYAEDPLGSIRAVLAIRPYPPLAHLATVPFTLLGGPKVDVAILVETAFFGILLGAVFQIGARLASVRAGLLSSLIVSLYPILYGLSRHLLLDVPLAAMVAAAVAAMLWSGPFAEIKRSALAGAIFGLGMLTKWTFAVFVVGPVAVVLVNLLMQGKPSRLWNFAVAAGAGVLVAAPWYIMHLSDLAYYLGLNSRASGLEGDPAVWSLSSWIHYADMLVNQQILLPAALLFLLGTILLLRQHGPDCVVGLLFAWIAIPYLAFSLFSNKDIRYTLPYLPAIALVTGIGLAQIQSRWLLWSLTAGIIIVNIPQFATFTFGSVALNDRETVSQLVNRYVGGLQPVIYKEMIHIVSPPRSENWQVAAILDRIVEDNQDSFPPEDPLQVLVLPNAPFFEPQGFIYHAQLMGAPMAITFVTGVGETDHDAVIEGADYIVTKTGDLGPVWSLQRAEEFSAKIAPGGELAGSYVLIDERPLPDGSMARVLRRGSADQ